MSKATICSVAAAALLLLPAASANAATSISSNWSGYVVTPSTSGTKYKTVSGSWVVPQGDCSSGAGYEATWVGIGGYKSRSQALEQTGTEFDCAADGTAKYSAWYELVPAPGKDLKMTVKPGDTIDVAVTVNAKRVTILLRNRTHKATFKKTFTMSSPLPDVSTAEWIQEAPSACNSAGQCAQLPIDNFGTVSFLRASATTARGHKGTISDPGWSPTTIQLSPAGGARRFVAASTGGATPSSLSGDGSSFSVSYSPSPPSSDPTPTHFPGAGGGSFG
jgi:hypothetical protein